MNSSVSAQRPARWLEWLARAGFFAKGVVYLLVGWLALQVALGQGGQTAGPQQALGFITRLPFGRTLLILVGLGLLAYAAWRLTQAALDPEHEADGGEGVVKRLGWAFSGLVYAGLGVSVFGGLGGGSGGSEGLVARLLAQPWGRWLVGLVALAIVGVGVYQFVRAAQRKFVKRLGAHPRWLERLGQAGFSARGVVYCVMGALFMSAALTYDASSAGGIGDALAALRDQPYGPWLLGLVALGLALYGVYAMLLVRYRRLRT